MNRGSYTAATGMVAQQTRLDVVANNLANVNTRGYKADRVTFADMMVRAVAEGGGTGAGVGSLASGPGTALESTDFTPGGSQATGNPLDLRLGGDTLAMFATQDAQGQVRYTRDGAFRLNDRSQLTTQTGELVLDAQRKPITVTGAAEIGPHGEVNVGGRTVATVGRFVGAFTKAEQGGNAFVSTNAQASDDVPVESRTLEMANVEPVSLMTEMIALNRAYEISQKMIQSQDESTAKLAETIG